MAQKIQYKEGVTYQQEKLFRWFYADITGRLSATKIGGEPWNPDPWQIKTLKSTASAEIDVKARQMGWSFIHAAKQFAKSQIKSRHRGNFVSYNLKEATNKIRYVNELWDSLPMKWRLKKVIDSKTELEFENGSRLVSHPCKAVRGETEADLIFDELAHYKDDRVYQGSTAAAVRAKQRSISIGSSPFGKRGTFWEIFSEDFKSYPAFHTHKRELPWWISSALCTDIKKAIVEAPQLLTEKRVRRFGTPALQEQFDLLTRDSFQQEFECSFLDIGLSFIDYETIFACMDGKLEWHETLDYLMKSKKGVFYAGYDVGRKRDAAELVILEVLGEKITARFQKTLIKTPFHEQRELLQDIMRCNICRLCIDATGMGIQLAEEMTLEYPGQVEPINFTNISKELMANEVKKAMEQRFLEIPADREFQQQIHSIKRFATKTGAMRYDTETNEKHHADKFWALALAVWAAKQSQGSEVNIW